MNETFQTTSNNGKFILCSTYLVALSLAIFQKITYIGIILQLELSIYVVVMRVTKKITLNIGLRLRKLITKKSDRLIRKCQSKGERQRLKPKLQGLTGGNTSKTYLSWLISWC